MWNVGVVEWKLHSLRVLEKPTGNNDTEKKMVFWCKMARWNNMESLNPMFSPQNRLENWDWEKKKIMQTLLGLMKMLVNVTVQ